MDVTDGSDEHFQLGVDRFFSGDPLAYHSVALRLDRGQLLQVDCYSDWEPERSSERHAKEKIERAKAVVAELIGRSRALRLAVENVSHEYYFCYDYGKGTITLAKETDGQFRWLHGTPDA